MLRRFAVVAVLSAAGAASCGWAATGPENEIRDFIAGWNVAYTGLDADALAKLETADFQLVDRFGHWIRSEGPEFNRQLWAMAFREIYKGSPGPARRLENIRFLASNVAVVQARAWHPDTTVLDDGTRIPPFWEINTYTLVKTADGWRVSVLNIHNQIDPGAERPGEHVPNASEAGRRK
jgi:ketosteroid isomerase-like protein